MLAGGRSRPRLYQFIPKGFIEVLRNLGTFIRTLCKVLADIEACRPRVVVLIDYPRPGASGSQRILADTMT